MVKSTWSANLDAGYLRLALFTSLAAFLAYLTAELIPMAAAVPAAITAVVAVRATFHHATKEMIFQILGALVGGAIALVIVSFIGSGSIVILLLVFLSFIMARLLRVGSQDESPFIAASLAVTVILVVGTHLTTELAVERFLGVAIGAMFALLASFLSAPDKESRVLANHMETSQSRIGALLEKIAEDLRAGLDRATARANFDRAVELRNDVLGLAARFDDLKRNRKWNPRVTQADIARLDKQMAANQTMSTRVLSLASDLRAQVSGPTPLPPAAVSPLADLIALAGQNIAAEDPATSVGRTAAHQALHGADMTAQLALIGGIVSHVNRINQATVHDEADPTETGANPT